MNSPGRKANVRRPLHADGFTLLEVILALGILAAALAVIGEVTRLSYVNAERAVLEGEAALVAESVIEQLVAGLLEPLDLPPTEWLETSADGSAEPRWRYSLTVLPTELPEILTVTVRVEQITAEPDDALSVELVRWVLNPDEVDLDAAMGAAG